MRQTHVEIGRTLGGRFEIVELLGQGGMSVVYRARDVKHDRPAAVKVLNASLARTQEFQQRFEREASLAQHAFHPNILPIWDSGEDGGVFYIAMPLARTDLGALIDAGTLETEKTLAIFAEIAWALDAAQARGIVHRDVKPENILLTDNPDGSYHAWLADFGVAKAGFSKTLTSDQIPFSAPYASPEQIQGRADLDGRSDQYSLACTLFEALTGRVPFDFPSQREMLGAHLSDFPPQITASRPDLPERLDAILTRALDKRPSARFGSCAELITEVRAAMSAGGAATAIVPEPGPPARTRADPARDDDTYVEPRPPSPPVSAETIVDRPPPAPEPVDGGGGSRSRKKLGLIAGAVAAIAALAVAGVLVLGGSGPKTLTVETLKAAWARGLECEPFQLDKRIYKVAAQASFECSTGVEETTTVDGVEFLLTKDRKRLAAELVRKHVVPCPGTLGNGTVVCSLWTVQSGGYTFQISSVLWADGRFSNVLVHSHTRTSTLTRSETLARNFALAKRLGTLREPAGA